MKQSLYVSGRSMNVSLERMDIISNNLANLNSTGYKKDMIYGQSFRDQLSQNVTNSNKGEIPKGNVVVTDFSSGNFKFTGEKMHVAIDGDGFFKVQMQDGRTGYTRRGEFSLNSSKQLCVGQSLVLGENGPIILPSTEVSIDSSGVIRSLNGNIFGIIKLVDFEKPYQLEKAGFTTFVPKDDITERQSAATLKQQYTEESNVSALTAMVEMLNLMDVMRQYETQQKMVQYHDDATEKMLRQLTQS